MASAADVFLALSPAVSPAVLVVLDVWVRVAVTETPWLDSSFAVPATSAITVSKSSCATIPPATLTEGDLPVPLAIGFFETWSPADLPLPGDFVPNAAPNHCLKLVADETSGLVKMS